MTPADSVKAAFFEGYRAMRGQFNLADFVEEAWEASESKRQLGEPAANTSHLWSFMAENAAKDLTVLADIMHKGLHGNLVDVPVSPKLDEWVSELYRIITALETP